MNDGKNLINFMASQYPYKKDKQSTERLQVEDSDSTSIMYKVLLGLLIGVIAFFLYSDKASDLIREYTTNVKPIQGAIIAITTILSMFFV